MKKEKKNIIIILLFIIILLLSILITCFILADDDKSKIDINKLSISREEALNIVLEDLKINQNDLYDLGIELERKYHTTVYEIDFQYHFYDYEYYVDAQTGKILKSHKERD